MENSTFNVLQKVIDDLYQIRIYIFNVSMMRKENKRFYLFSNTSSVSEVLCSKEYLISAITHTPINFNDICETNITFLPTDKMSLKVVGIFDVVINYSAHIDELCFSPRK